MTIDFFQWQDSSLIRENPNILSNLWGAKKLIKQTLCDALNGTSFDRETFLLQKSSSNFTFFIDKLAENIRSLDELLDLVNDISPKILKHQVVYHILASKWTNFGVYVFGFDESFFNLSDRYELEKVDFSLKWIELGILYRGVALLSGAKSRRFELNQLIPIFLSGKGKIAPEMYGVSRSIIGTAFDNSQLSECALDKLISVFENDAYFKRQLNI